MPPLSLVTKLAGFWVAKKIVLFGAIKMYGPGRLYRRTLNWNRYLLGSFPPLQRGGTKGLSFMFRLPDRLAGKHKGLIKGAPSAASTAMARQAEAINAGGAAAAASVKPAASSTTASSVLSKSFAGFSASPLVQSARAAKQRMYSRLPSKEAIRSTITRGGQRATSLLRMPTQNRAALSDNAELMWQLRRIRSIYLQAQPAIGSYV